MASNSQEMRRTGASRRSLSLYARAIALSVSVFIIVTLTFGPTAAALVWGVASLLGLGSSAGLLALLVGGGGSLPLALWLMASTYRLESAGASERSDEASSHPAGAIGPG